MGLSRHEFAQRIGDGTSERDIELLEESIVLFPSWIRLLRIAEALEVPFDSLIGLDDSAC